MGLIKGTATFVKFTIEGDLPENPLEYISERIKAFSFQDIDDTFDEYSIGWVSLDNMFDSSFKYASYLVGDYIVLTLRIDERKVSSAILKKIVRKEELRMMAERQLPKLSRSVKIEIKERVRAELVRKSIPVPSTFDLCWNLSESTLLFFSTNKKIHAVVEDFFKECFGVFLKQQIPYTLAEQLLDEEQLFKLAALTPQIFTVS